MSSMPVDFSPKEILHQTSPGKTCWLTRNLVQILSRDFRERETARRARVRPGREYGPGDHLSSSPYTDCISAPARTERSSQRTPRRRWTNCAGANSEKLSHLSKGKQFNTHSCGTTSFVQPLIVRPTFPRPYTASLTIASTTSLYLLVGECVGRWTLYAFMVDRLAGQNTLTTLSHIEATQSLVTPYN